MIDRYIVDTPENIEFAYDVAGIGSRFLAAIVDSAIIVVAQVLVLYLLSLAISGLTFAESAIIATMNTPAKSSARPYP